MAAKMPVSSGGASKELSPAELSRRVAVVKRFKELLKAQRDRFSAYLDSLDRQKDVIEGGSAEDLLRHVELEEKIMADIFSIQKVIDPLEEIYRSAAPAPRAASKSGEDDVSGLKEALEGLKTEAAIRSEQNRKLLSKRMAELRSEINNLRNNPYAGRRSANSPAPTRIDISG